MTELVQYQRWPRYWPANIPLHVRWPFVMLEQGAWPYQMTVNCSDWTPVRPPGFPDQSVATFQQFANGTYVWDVVPSILGPQTVTKLSVQIFPDSVQPTHYAWAFTFLHPPLQLWQANEVFNRWDETFAPPLTAQAQNWETRVSRILGVPTTFRVTVFLIRGCRQLFPAPR